MGILKFKVASVVSRTTRKLKKKKKIIESSFNTVFKKATDVLKIWESGRKKGSITKYSFF